MKRSTMVLCLKDIIDHDILTTTDSYYLQRQDYADYILTNLEKLGMLPPMYDGQAVLENEISQFQWEPENE